MYLLCPACGTQPPPCLHVGGSQWATVCIFDTVTPCWRAQLEDLAVLVSHYIYAAARPHSVAAELYIRIAKNHARTRQQHRA